MNKQKLLLNQILKLNDSEIKNSKIVLNMTMGSGQEECLDVWLRDGNVNFSYHSHYTKEDTKHKSRNFNQLGTNVFGFVRLGNDRYLLVTVGSITEIPKVDDKPRPCLFKPVLEYQGLIGRLIVNISKGNAYARYAFNMDTLLEDATVEQILPKIYGTQPFPGYENLHLSYYELKAQIDYDEWKSPLSNINGIYLLTDTFNGKRYVGSATGVYGVYGRWKTYLAEGYDKYEEQSGKAYPNSKLRKLVEKNKIDYIKKYFMFSILEILPKTITRDNAIRREKHWKDVLSTRKNEYGYNSN